LSDSNSSLALKHRQQETPLLYSAITSCCSHKCLNQYN